MSHITTIKTKVEMVCEPCLQKALAKVKETIPEFNYEKVGKNYQVNYTPINTNYAPKNMLFQHGVNKEGKNVWVIRGDRYGVQTEFDRVLKEIEFNYSVTGMQVLMSKNMYQTQTTPNKEGMLILATRY